MVSRYNDANCHAVVYGTAAAKLIKRSGYCVAVVDGAGRFCVCVAWQMADYIRTSLMPELVAEHGLTGTVQL